MAYRVELSEPARQDIAEAATFIATDSPERAGRWILLLEQLFDSLCEMPRRFPRVPELTSGPAEYREARHFSHRVIFRIDEDSCRVQVVRVYHVARKPLAVDA